MRVSGRLYTVPCGTCTFCLMSKRADWTFRINQEARHSDSAFFITLTYGNYDLPIGYVSDWAIRRVYPYQHSLVKEDYQLFFKRLRKEAHPVRLRYYTCGEYGELNGRPHYHIILFNLPVGLLPRLEKIWGKGFVNIGQVNLASIHYVTKYVMKRKGEYGGREPPFALMSRRPGIGSCYLKTHGNWHRKHKRNYTEVNGFKNRLPRYYRERFFSSVEREALAVDSIREADNMYWDAVEQLRKHHDNPEGYYYERLVYLYESSTKQIEKNGKVI